MSDAPRKLDELQRHEKPPFDAGLIGPEQWSVTRWVRWSLDVLAAKGEAGALTRTFYQQLFIIAPQVKGMFADDIGPQSDRLLVALLISAKAMDDPDKVAETEADLRHWGELHRRFLGVSDEMYGYVSHALVRAINIHLGRERSRVQSSWITLLQWMVAVMVAGADEADKKYKNPKMLLYPTPQPAPVVHRDQQRELREPEQVVVPRQGRAARVRRRYTG